MMLNRRQFVGHLSKTAAIGVLGVSLIELDGCNVISDIQSWIPAGEAAVNAILSILAANGVPIAIAVSAAAGLVETGLNDLLAAIAEYQTTNPPPAGTLAKIETALQDVSDQFSKFVSQLSTTGGPILATIVGIAQVVLSTIGGFLNRLPATAPVARLRTEIKLNGTVVAPVSRSLRSFKKSVNSQLDAAKKAGLKVPNAAYEPVSFFEHF